MGFDPISNNQWLYIKTKSLKKKSCDNRVIHKVLKDRVPILGLTKKTSNTKMHDMHFPKAKKTKVNSKLAF